MVHTASPLCHFTEPNVWGALARYECAGAYPLHIDMNKLERLHLYFAFGEKKQFCFTDASTATTTSDAAPVATASAAH